MTNKYREQYFDHARVTVIEPPKGLRLLDWLELWAYRELLVALTMRDVKVRYKQTILGAAWALIRPLVTMVIFSIVFGQLVKIPSDGLPYPIFVYSGLLPWTFFATAVGSAGQSLIGSSQLVSKVYFPRLIIPLSAVGAALVDLLISTSVLLLMMLWYEVGWTVNILMIPILFICLIFSTLGVGTLLSAITVAYRDFTHITPFLLQIWMYVTPVIFPLSIIPDRLKWLMYINPMAGIIESFRSAFLGKPFDAQGLIISFVAAVGMFIIGVAYFEKVERRFADII